MGATSPTNPGWPKVNGYPGVVSGTPGGPICECDRLSCGQELPKRAWRYVGVEGQFVVLPGHQEPHEKFFPMSGFYVAVASGA